MIDIVFIATKDVLTLILVIRIKRQSRRILG